jgi:hypothetical protein
MKRWWWEGGGGVANTSGCFQVGAHSPQGGNLDTFWPGWSKSYVASTYLCLLNTC